MQKFKLIAMDLDGTLTQHKSQLNEKNTQLLNELQKQYKLVMLGAGGCKRIYDQMNGFPIDIVGNYGIQESTIRDGELAILRNDKYEIDKEFFEKTITEIREITGYTEYSGDNVEFHASGLVTFPLLGTDAKIEDKLSFDPDGKKRSAIYDMVAERFSGYNCFIGGSSSFDISIKKYNKYYSLLNYIAPRGIKPEEVLFIGDDFKRGGNDESVMLGGIKCIKIVNYLTITETLQNEKII